MINKKFKTRSLGITFLVFSFLASVSFAQSKDAKSTVMQNQEGKKMSVAERNNVYCAGYIQNSPVKTNFEIVGANDQREQNVYSQGDLLYVNQGASNGIKVGDVYSVIRPSGKFGSQFSKKGKLGVYVQEVGSVEIVRVRSGVSVARVKTSCDNFLLGDLLKPWENRVAPAYTQRPALDTLAESTGKAMGRIVLSRDAREALGREQIVYIDLGTEDNVKVGDYLTIFRPLDKGGVLNAKPDETMSASDSEYGSNVYQGSPYSILAARKAGENAEGNVVTTSDAKTRRPAGLRRVVGEMVILNVHERAATALITRNAQEIHTGDMVEIQ